MSIKLNFEGKVVLITGSSSGIGAETSLLFTKSGANVVVTGRNADNVSKVAQKCGEVSKNNSKVLEVLSDVTKEEDLKRLVNETIKTFGKLDILVNNAGAGWATNIIDQDFIEIYKKTLDINLNPMVLLTHLCVDHLIKTKGNIINISSIAALRVSPKSSPYSIAKVGIDMFTRCMAAELGPKGVRVNVINPGLVKTNFLETMGMNENTINAFRGNIANRLPMGRIGEGIDIATAILLLAADDSSFITGSNLVSDGGFIGANIGW